MKRIAITLVFLLPLILGGQTTTSINGVEVLDGEIEDFVGEILETGTSGVIIRDGGDSIFWADTKIVLKPGFEAEEGSLFWAAIDTDGDGFTDIEEATDSDGDGMFDMWEFLNGLDPFNSGDASIDNDGDGYSNLTEFNNGWNPLVDNGWQEIPGPELTLPIGEDVLIITPENKAFSTALSDMLLYEL